MTPALPWWRRPWARWLRRVLSALAGVGLALGCRHFAPPWMQPFCQALTSALLGAE